MTDTTSAVIYAAKSTEDKHGSIPTQMDDCRNMAERERWEVAAAYTDEAFSAYHGDRGPGLAQAREHAARIAASEGRCVLVAQHSDRFARGDGLQAQHLAEFWFAVRREGVELRTVQDDSTFTNPLLIMALGERNTEDSRRKAAATKAGLRRRVAERGEPNGGRSYGYRAVTVRDGSGEPLLTRAGRVARTLEIEPSEAVIVRRVFDEYVGGKAQATIARDLESEQVPTLRGRHWYASMVYKMLRNPLYVGEVTNNGETFPGKHEPIVDRETWEAASQLREGRHTHGGRPRGRRAVGSHLLTEGLLLCACGSRMTPETRRKNGWVSEVYRCARGKVHTGVCSQKPIKRDAVDRAVYEFFEHVALDEDATRNAFREHAGRELLGASALLGQAENELARADSRLAKINRGWQDEIIDDQEYAEQRAELLTQREAAAAQADQLRRRQQRVEQAISTIDVELAVARQLTAIRRQVAGEVNELASLQEIRAVLRRLFAAFVLLPPDSLFPAVADGQIWPDWVPVGEEARRRRDGYRLVPFVRLDAAFVKQPDSPDWLGIRKVALPVASFYTPPTGPVTSL